MLNKKLEIDGKKILLVGFWGHQNMGDELILLGNIKLLQKQDKEIFIVSQDNEWLKKFLKQFVDISDIVFIQELPRGARSLIKYIKNKKYKELRVFRKIDAIILGGGEILTEESPHAYYYWFWSLWPSFWRRKKLYIMGGIQVPKKRYNKILFKFTLKHTTQILCRDFEEIDNIKKNGFNEVDFFMDTSYFAIENWSKYKVENKNKYIIVNLNSKGQQFVNDLIVEIDEYLKNNYIVYYLPVCAGKTDDDTRYFLEIAEKVKNKNFIKTDRTNDFFSFLKLLGGAESTIGARLHLFLISEFIGLNTKVYPYQKKINKMNIVLNKLNIKGQAR